MFKWSESRLGDLTKKIGSGATPTGGSNAYKLDGISLIRSQNVLDFDFSYDGLAFIDNDQADALKNVAVQENDVLLNITGDSVARACKVPKKILPARVNQHVAIIRADATKLDSDFLLYYLQAVKETLLIHAEIGATRNALTKGMLENFTVIAPELSEQRAIAEVLNSLGDKIDLLHRQNNTLECLGQTLFRHWFIDHASDDWKEGTLADFAYNIREGIQPSKISANTKYVGLEHIERRHIALHSYGSGSDVESNKSVFKKHDILFGKLRPYFHKVCFAPFDGICSTDILVIRPKTPSFFASCLFAFFQKEVVDHSDMASEGTRMPRTNWEILRGYPIQIPDYTTLTRFNEIVEPMLRRIEANIGQIASLIATRDAILPKLMSGEVSRLAEK